MPSKAFQTLVDQRLGEIAALLLLRPASRERVEEALALNRAATVLLCAHLEGFVEDLVGEAIDILNEARPAAARLPLLLRAAHVEVEVDKISEMTDIVKRAERIELLFTEYAYLFNRANEELDGRLSTEAVTRGMSNPGAPEIERLFSVIGVDEVFADVELPDEADVEKRINELVGVRNSIAHGGVDTTVTNDQVQRYVEAVEYFGRSVDGLVASSVQQVCNSAELPWT